MRETDSAKVLIADEGKRAQSPIWVIECDAIEMPEIWERRQELMPNSHNLNFAQTHIFQGASGGLYGREWYGPLSAYKGEKAWAAANKLVREGWADGIERGRTLGEKLKAILPDPETVRRTTHWREDGGELDRDRLYSSGIETAFRGTRQKRMRAPKGLKIVKSQSMNCGYSADQYAWNGAAIMGLMDILEGADYRAELVCAYPAIMGGWGDGESHTSMPVIRVKAANEPLSLPAVAAVACHAAAFRAYVFAMYCTSPYAVDHGLGHPTTAKETWEKAVTAGMLEPVDAFMDLAHDEKSALRACVATLRQIFPSANNDEFDAKLEDMMKREGLV